MSDHPTPDRWERDTLIQLGEQVKGLRYDVNRHSDVDEDMFRKIEIAMQSLRVSLDSNTQSVHAAMEAKFVTKAEFNPTRLIAYGLVGLIVVSVVTAWLSIVVAGRTHGP